MRPPVAHVRKNSRRTLYGNNESAVALSVKPKELTSILQSATGHNTIFTLTFQDAKTTSVMLKDWQFEPIKGHLLHADLVRIAMDKVLQVNVPITTVGEAKGVKLEGGIFEFVTARGRGGMPADGHPGP
jgi:large subunit ribosomal protein L25